MKFYFKKKYFLKKPSNNQTMRIWLSNTGSNSITLDESDFDFSTIILRGFLYVEFIKLNKNNEKIIANVQFNRWILILAAVAYLSFMIFLSLNGPKDESLEVIIAFSVIGILCMAFSYFILWFDVRRSLSFEKNK